VQKKVCLGFLSRYEGDCESFFFFCHGLSLGMKYGSVTFNCRQKDSHWSGIVHLLLLIRSLGTPQQGKLWPLFFWDAEGAILVHIVPCGQTVNSDMYCQTLNTLQKLFSRV
jgi:hypothetical protein